MTHRAAIGAQSHAGLLTVISSHLAHDFHGFTLSRVRSLSIMLFIEELTIRVAHYVLPSLITFALFPEAHVVHRTPVDACCWSLTFAALSVAISHALEVIRVIIHAVAPSTAPARKDWIFTAVEAEYRHFITSDPSVSLIVRSVRTRAEGCAIHHSQS